VVTWYGALEFAALSHNDDLRERLIRRFEPLQPGGSEQSRIPQRLHVDDSVFGVVPLEIAIQTGSVKYRTMGLVWADRQWSHPNPEGLSQESRLWIDDMYMITILQLEAYRSTHDRKYLDRSAHEMGVYLDTLQQANGLFYHAPDIPFYWARGDGWVASGMAEILRDLPESHPDRPRILRGYRAMMQALAHYQCKDGMWRQIIDRDDAWPETSGSAMFTFALVTGVRNGWLDDAIYAPVARKAWIAISGYIDQHGDVTNVCEGTNKKNDLAYYLARRRLTGDFHGQAPVLWTVDALLRPSKKRG
jgi:rhamnogalacturonyl hydrolase YesR